METSIWAGAMAMAAGIEIGRRDWLFAIWFTVLFVLMVRRAWIEYRDHTAPGEIE